MVLHSHKARGHVGGGSERPSRPDEEESERERETD